MPTNNNFPLNKTGKAIPVKEAVIKSKRPAKPIQAINPNRSTNARDTTLSYKSEVTEGVTSTDLSSSEIMGIANIASNIFNSKKYPTLYNDDELRAKIMNNAIGRSLVDTEPPPTQLFFQPNFDMKRFALDVAKNPTPLGVGIAFLEQITEYDMMGQVEKQLAYMRESQLYNEMRNEELSQAALMGLSRQEAQLESEMTVMGNHLAQSMQSKIKVLTGKKVEIPKNVLNKLQYQWNPNNTTQKMLEPIMTEPYKTHGAIEKGTKRFLNSNEKIIKKTTIIGSILNPVYKNRFKFRKSISHLLSKASNVEFEKIQNGYVEKSNPEVFNLPFYKSGSITLPISGENVIISTENFFKSSTNRFYDYLEHMAHEVKHFDHIGLHKGDFNEYIKEFTRQYSKTLSHDGARYEIQAEFGEYIMKGFVQFTNNYYGKDSLWDLFSNKFNSEEVLINRIDQWWSKYEKSTEYIDAIIKYYKEVLILLNE